MNGVTDIETRWVVITSDEKFQLAAEVATYLSDAEKYVVFLRFPVVEFPHEDEPAFGRDGYISRVHGDRAATSIANTLFRMHIHNVMLLGLTPTQKSYLTPKFMRHDMVIEASSLSEVIAACNIPAKSELRCRPAQGLRGVAAALRGVKQIVFDDAADDIDVNLEQGGDRLVVLEEGDDIDGLAAVLFCVTSGSDLRFTHFVDRSVVRGLPRMINRWSRDRSDVECLALRRKMIKPLKRIKWSKYKVVTFFTEGVPYGLFLQNCTTFVHVLRNLDGSIYILNRLLDEHVPRNFESGLVFSPQAFADEEISWLHDFLEKHHLATRLLVGKAATVQNLDDFGSYYPYDLLHICSHGGETDGYFVMRDFIDRVGAPHRLEYFEVVSFGDVIDEKVLVHQKLIFQRLDGRRWMSDELRDYPKYVFDDMLGSIKQDSGVTRIPYKSAIPISCHIQCSGSFHQGQFQQLAGFGMPVVFNNSCSSSHELAVNFIHAGARAYIGTLWSIGNREAIAAAEAFYRELGESGSIAQSFSSLLSAVKGTRYSNVYVLWGFPCASFHWPPKRNPEKALFHSGRVACKFVFPAVT